MSSSGAATGDYFFHFTKLLGRAWQMRLASWGHPELAEKISIERPAVKEHGDLACNLAMMAAGAVGRPPRDLAAELVADVEADTALSAQVESATIAGPGFINFFLAGKALHQAARGALKAGGGYGSGGAPSSEKILLEYVSANPTGPLHVGHARYAAYGDSLKRILSFAGHLVTTEFYINDYGSQMDVFGRSLAARYGQELGRSVAFPEEGYQGEYPVHVAKKIIDEVGDLYLEDVDPEPSPQTIDFFKNRGRDLVLEEMREILGIFRVSFDNWFSEKSLYERGAVDQAVDGLKKANEIEEKEGALWLVTTRYGDDKDRVLIRSSGEPTYFASDIAYHRNKLGRGFDRLINIWGADHHGYVPRMKAAFESLAHDSGRLEIIIGQLVNVMEMGERKQMSKRAGTMVTLGELIDSIGVDAARFFLVDRSHDSTLDLDIEKARLKSEENPVYYVQYAHARICSILKKAEEAEVKAGGAAGSVYEETEAQEKELILKLLELPGAVNAAASSREPHRLTVYARELAATFHVFYHNCPVIRAAPEITEFRLGLCRLTRESIARCLDLVGVKAPETM